MRLVTTMLLAAMMAIATAADLEAGVVAALDRDRGDCGVCHVLPAGNAEQQGNVGPSLVGVGARLSQAQIRERIADPKKLNPESIMPAYARRSGRYRMDMRYRGEPLMSNEEIDAIALWLAGSR